MTYVFFDSETRSESDLKLAGSRNYAEHSSTSVMCSVWVWDDQGIIWVPNPPRRFSEKPESYLGKDFSPEDFEWTVYAGPTHPPVPTDRPWVAHNGDMFDRRVWEAAGYPTPDQWVDSMKLARRASLPASLDGLSSVLHDIGKHAGASTLQRLCKPDKRSGRIPPLNHKNIRPLISYCIQDVLMMRASFLSDLSYHVSATDDEVLRLDQEINDRGVGFDVDLAKFLMDLEHDVRTARGDTLSDLTDGEITRETLRSSHKVKKIFSDKFGIELENTQKGTLIELLEDPLYSGEGHDMMRMVIEARIGENGISSAKLLRGLLAGRESGQDVLLHDLFAYHAADTGRWGGRVIQPHNFPRGSLRPDDYAEILTLLIAQSQNQTIPREKVVESICAVAEGVSSSAILGSLTRSTLIPARGFKYFASADYSSVEARTLLWLAGDEKGLQQYREGVDLYRQMASVLFNKPYDQVTKGERQIGKIPVLGGGYGMGAEGMTTFGRGFGVDFEALGVDPQWVVDTYRDANSLVAGERTGELYEGYVCRSGGLWKAYHKAAMDTISTGQGRFVHKVSFFMNGPHLTLRLPSGKLLTYRWATIEDVDNPWGSTSRTWVYSRSFFKNTLRTAQTKGKITENICQAIATGSGGFTGHSMRLIDDAGYNMVLHTHDDITVEVNSAEDATRFCDIMAITPEWAVGFPQRVEGHMGRRLTKEPLPGDLHLTSTFER